MRHGRDDYEQIQDPSGKIPDDEPVFLLRGQDRLTEKVLEYWLQLARRNQVSFATIDRVTEHLGDIRRWPKKKYPDTPGEE